MKTLRLLIADDDPEIRLWLEAGLEQEGAEIVGAESGAELVDLLSREGPFDLVISDVRMSWATGLQALSMARGAGIETPFVLITAHADPPTRRAAAALGALLLEKPLDIEVLSRLVAEISERGAARAG